MLEDRGVRPARHVAAILRVPVREQHHQHLQSVELRSADEWIVVPRPAVLLEELAHRRVVQLEAGILERAVVVDAGPGTLQLVAAGAGDRPRRDVVGRLGVVAARPDQSDGEVLGLHLVAPLDPPAPAACIPDGNAGLRSGRVFFDEGVGRNRLRRQIPPGRGSDRARRRRPDRARCCARLPPAAADPPGG